MKICVIHGSPRKGNTYKAAQLFMEQLRKNGEVEFTEFFLSKDMPEFCCGCYNCFFKSEGKCPHSQYTQPIEQAMREADGMIFTSPVFALAESGQMKVLLDHYSYLYMSHRPMEEMFSKVAMIITTTAGAGTKNVVKPISRSLTFWGVRKIFSCRLTIFAKSWNEMNEKKQKKFSGILRSKANKFYRAAKRRKRLHTGIYTRFLFFAMKKLMSGYEDGHTDKQYWMEKGWLSGQSRPF